MSEDRTKYQCGNVERVNFTPPLTTHTPPPPYLVKQRQRGGSKVVSFIPRKAKRGKFDNEAEPSEKT